MDNDDDLDNLDFLLDGVIKGQVASDKETFLAGSPAEPSLVRDVENPDYQWARDVFWAYENQGGRISKTQAGSAGRYRLWEMATKDFDNFVKNMLSKALPVIERMRAAQGTETDQIIEMERKEIEGMKKLLKAAIIEASATDYE